MTRKFIDLIERDYAKTRENHEEERQRLLIKLKQSTDFSALYGNLQILYMKSGLSKADGDLDKAAIYDSDIEKTKTQLSEVLKNFGLNSNDLELKYDCDYCKDTGYINGTPCKCFFEKYKNYTLNSIGIHMPNFPDFDMDTAEKSSILKKNYRLADKFVEKFPNTNIKNFVFQGKSGTGKTFLAGRIAKRIIEKNFDVFFLSAFSLNNLFLKYVTSKDDDRYAYMDILTDCDFLVIDDLGTEPILRNITVEYLLAVISDRLSNGKHTLITTNLTNDELLQRYNERFFSRISEKKFSAILDFGDTNLRVK